MTHFQFFTAQNQSSMGSSSIIFFKFSEIMLSDSMHFIPGFISYSTDIGAGRKSARYEYGQSGRNTSVSSRK